MSTQINGSAAVRPPDFGVKVLQSPIKDRMDDSITENQDGFLDDTSTEALLGSKVVSSLSTTQTAKTVVSL